MAWDGSGNWTPQLGPYTGVNIHTQAAQAAEKVRADRLDSFVVDLKASLQNAVLRDGQNTPSGNLPMGANKHTNVADAVARSEYASYGQLLDAVGTFVSAGEVGGTANAITLTPATPITAYVANQTFSFTVKAQNSGAVTLAVSGLSPVATTKAGTVALVSGDLRVGARITVQYDGTRFQVLSGLSIGDAFQVSEVSATASSVSSSDDFVISDDSLGDDANARITATAVRNFMLGDANNIRVLTQAAYNALTPDANTLYFTT